MSKLSIKAQGYVNHRFWMVYHNLARNIFGLWCDPTCLWFDSDGAFLIWLNLNLKRNQWMRGAVWYEWFFGIRCIWWVVYEGTTSVYVCSLILIMVACYTLYLLWGSDDHCFAFIVDLHHSSFPLFNCGLMQLLPTTFAYTSTTIWYL